MIKLRDYFVFLVCAKIALDFFSPFREVNFILFIGFSLLGILVNSKSLSKIGARPVFVVLVYLIYVFWLFFESGQFEYLLKFGSLVFVFLVVRLSVANFSLSDYYFVSKFILLFFSICLLVNYVASFMFYSPQNRSFYNFEHVNLLGSYILLMFSFLPILFYFSSRGKCYRAYFSLMSLLSTSLGAFVCSLIAFVDFRRIGLRFVFGLPVVLFLSVVVIWVMTKSNFPVFHTKLFGFFYLLIDGFLSDLIFLSEHRLPLSELGGEYKSSLVWRIYSYLVFYDYFFNLDLVSFLFGAGFLGYELAWQAYMPHNDFILILIDFGFVFFVVFVYFLLRAFFWSWLYCRIVIPIFLIFFLRMFFENNIYSYYVCSGLVLNAVFLYCFLRKLRLGGLQ